MALITVGAWPPLPDRESRAKHPVHGRDSRCGSPSDSVPELQRPRSERQSLCSQKPREHALCELGRVGGPGPSAGWGMGRKVAGGLRG